MQHQTWFINSVSTETCWSDCLDVRNSPLHLWNAVLVGQQSRGNQGTKKWSTEAHSQQIITNQQLVVAVDFLVSPCFSCKKCIKLKVLLATQGRCPQQSRAKALHHCQLALGVCYFIAESGAWSVQPCFQPVFRRFIPALLNIVTNPTQAASVRANWLRAKG